mmetsp:Transcript_16400/g.24176  ORF Transcript_16400/g.24176 Transcript_16400/m.24176 type:complete len:242 (+) Transcript_16400:107-832(+)|eukprot:CAMPEP_0194232394 /NCGR_PEP_ID=MMETSP0158-20130606/780_1 /TAXON_ID=33649 /ORGANISM="Thalassionema nitzschioides, Strain L26-B" /LENGTH=241 /DNA_ID=CAMNT_0038965147 /DNA_START=35 /DNA_END=760 /DNA_ORIENTATION=+
MSEANSSKSSSKDGIDIQKALDILSLRTSDAGSVGHHDHSHDCQHHVPQGGQEMGQTIELVQDEVESLSKSMEDQRKILQEEQKKTGEKIKEKLETMTVVELLNKVMESQEDRVAAYREYDAGLEDVLQSGNMTKYPAICAKATASFSFLSSTIMTIQSILQNRHKRSDLAKMIELLQRQEQEKLNLTAALHLEQIRIGDNDSADHLLRDGVSTLRQKNADCVEAINDILDEIRFEIAEAD